MLRSAKFNVFIFAMTQQTLEYILESCQSSTVPINVLTITYFTALDIYYPPSHDVELSTSYKNIFLTYK